METQKQVVDALMTPDAYNEASGQIEMLQTHISFVFLTKDFVYKVKKSVNFGFLDFSTLEKRRFFCEKELELNSRLCKDIYLEVVSINKTDTIKIGGPGETIEYALKMKRLPQDRIMNKLLEENKVNDQLIDQLAKKIAEFHLKAETNEVINKIGSLETVKINWKENFEQTQNVIGKTISAKDFDFISKHIEEFMEKNKTLFEKRLSDGKIKDCHGDIHSGNIFITDKIYVFDAIEFNERFRYGDVTSDMAFLAMDLDFKGRKDLSTLFVNKYIEYSKDYELEKLLRFYKCYRAYVRGKVVGFRLNDPNVSDVEKINAEKEAKAYFDLAKNYVEEF